MIKVAKKIGSTFSNAGGVNQEAIARLRQAAQLSISHIYDFLKTNPDGLTVEEVELKQEQYGFNDVRHDRPPTWVPAAARCLYKSLCGHFGAHCRCFVHY